MVSKISEPLQQLIDVAIEHNLVPSEYFALWDEIGEWQMNALKALGIEPESYLLDVGCGALRLGIKAVDFLSDGHFYGVDAFPPYIDMGKTLLAKRNQLKNAILKVDDNFEFSSLNQTFDFSNAQSVFTHLNKEQTIVCMKNLKTVMRKDGKMLFTYIVGDSITQGFLYAANLPMFRPSVESVDFYKNAADDLGIKFEKWNYPHPTGQEVGILTF